MASAAPLKTQPSLDLPLDSSVCLELSHSTVFEWSPNQIKLQIKLPSTSRPSQALGTGSAPRHRSELGCQGSRPSTAMVTLGKSLRLFARVSVPGKWG